MPPQVVWEVRHGGEFHACEACGKLVYSAEAPHVAEEPADAR